MPTIKTVSVHYERKVSTGQFESATVGVTLWADLDADESETAAMSDLWTMAKSNVKAQLLPLKGKTDAQVEHIFLGLPVALQEVITEGNNGHHD